MIYKKGFHDCCECSQLEIEIGEVRSQLDSGLMDESDYDQKVKFLILRDMVNQYRIEFANAIDKLSNDLEKSISYHNEEDDSGSGMHHVVEESELKFRNRCFGRFESLLIGVPKSKPTDD